MGLSSGFPGLNLGTGLSLGGSGLWVGGSGLSEVVTQLLVPPSGFDLTMSYTISRTSDGAYSTDFDITSIAPAVTVTYYVDPVNGSDANGGTTPEDPLKSLSVALAKADVDGVEFISAADVIMRSTVAWSGANVARSVRVRNQTGFRVISAFASATLPVFTAHATYPNVYQSTTTAPTQMVDTNIKTAPVNPRPGLSVTDVPTEFLTMTNVASAELVRDTAGSWHHNGTVLYVHLADNRTAIGDGKLIKCLSGVNGRAGGTNGTVVYIDGIDFVGGASSFNYATGTAGHTGTLATRNCTFQASNTTGNGCTIVGKIAVFHDHSACYASGLDSFSYHAFGSDGTDSVNSPTFLENGCVSKGSGTTGSAGASDNASTAHEGAEGVRLNCVYVNSDDRVLVDINFAKTWNLNCAVGPSVKTGAGSELVVTQNSAQMCMDGCWVAEGDSSRFSPGTGSTIYYRNMSGVTNSGLGTLAPY